MTTEAYNSIDSFYTLKMSSLCIHLSVLLDEMIRVAEFLLPSLVPGLKYRWREAH